MITRLFVNRQNCIRPFVFELITDIDPDDPTRTTGRQKPTRLARFVHRMIERANERT